MKRVYETMMTVGLSLIAVLRMAGCSIGAPSEKQVARDMEKKYGEKFEFVDQDSELSQYKYRTDSMTVNEKIAVSYREKNLQDEYASYLLQDDVADYKCTILNHWCI